MVLEHSQWTCEEWSGGRRPRHKHQMLVAELGAQRERCEVGLMVQDETQREAAQAGGGQVAGAEDSLVCRRCRVGEPIDPGGTCLLLVALGDREGAPEPRVPWALQGCRKEPRRNQGCGLGMGRGQERDTPRVRSGNESSRGVWWGSGADVEGRGQEGSRGRDRECRFQSHLNRRRKSKSWTKMREAEIVQRTKRVLGTPRELALRGPARGGGSLRAWPS